MKPPPGRVGSPLGLFTANRWGSLKRNSKRRGVWFDPGRTVPDKGLACSDRFGSGGGDAVEGDLAVVQILLPGFPG